METAHKRPNYILIWVYLAVLTAAELALAFELPISRNLKLLLLLFLATWKAALVGLFFMHLKFERWNLRCMKNRPTRAAFHVARNSSNRSFRLREIGNSNASASSAAVR